MKILEPHQSKLSLIGKDNSRTIQCTQVFHSNWLEDVIPRKVNIFGGFSSSGQLGNSATDPEPLLAVSAYAFASVLATVTSQVSGFPPCHGINASPSGRLPSCLTKPNGSLVAGIPAEVKARQTISFSM